MFPHAVRRALSASAAKQPALSCGETTCLRRTHQAGHEHRSRGRVWSVIAAAAAAIAAALCIAGPAHAAWREVPVPLSATDQLAAVSCAQQCVAVGSSANGVPFALHSTPQGWTREPMPLPPRHPRLPRLQPAAYFSDVSCTSPQNVRRRRRRPMLCGIDRALERAPVGDTAGWTALLRRSPVLRRLVCLGALVSGARSRPGALERPPLGHRWQGQAGSGADCVRGSPVVRVRRSRSKWVQGRGWCLGRSWPAHPHLGTGTRHPFVLQRPVMYVAELMPGGR